jgi:hypothetical protein
LNGTSYTLSQLRQGHLREINRLKRETSKIEHIRKCTLERIKTPSMNHFILLKFKVKITNA